MDVIITRNRKLEQFFFLHGVDYIAVGKDEEGLTVWHYERTEENVTILREFRLAQERRAKKGA